MKRSARVLLITILAWVALLILTGCTIPLAVSGASAPTPYVFLLTQADIERANADDCAQTWITGDDAVDIEQAHKELSRYGVRVRYGGNPLADGTAGRHTLWLRDEVKKWDTDAKVRLLSHELVHYCDRDRVSDADFEAAYFHSAGRWVYETRAYAQTYRTMKQQGWRDNAIERDVERRLVSMRDKYLLHDIAADQYMRETRRALLP